jgi:hypothetical protein
MRENIIVRKGKEAVKWCVDIWNKDAFDRLGDNNGKKKKYNKNN